MDLNKLTKTKEDAIKLLESLESEIKRGSVDEANGTKDYGYGGDVTGAERAGETNEPDYVDPALSVEGGQTTTPTPVEKEKQNIDEAEMSDSQKAHRERIVKGMKKNKEELQAKYGNDWENVMYATATKMAMKENLSQMSDEAACEACEKQMQTYKEKKEMSEMQVQGGENVAGETKPGVVASPEAQPGVQPEPVVTGNFSVEGGEAVQSATPGVVASPEAQPGVQPEAQVSGNFSVEGGEDEAGEPKPQQPSLMAEAQMSEEDLQALFGSDLQEEFKEKVQTIFEAAVNSKVKKIEESLKTKYDTQLDESVQAAENDLIENIDGILDKVAETFIAENKVAIESSVRVHLLEQFVDGIRSVVVENHIDLPTEKIDVVEALVEENKKLEQNLASNLNESAQMKKELADLKKAGVIQSLGESLVATEYSKFKDLCESVSYASIEEFEKKAETIYESYFKGSKKPQAVVNESQEKKPLNESAESVEQKRMKKYLETIAKTSTY